MTYSIWFFLWLLISIGLLGFSVWTFIILMRQKKSWREFAKKHKLRYRNATLMSSPRLNGVYNGYTIGMFTGEHESERGGANRKLTAIEVELNSKMPISGAFASGGMVGIVQEMTYNNEFVPQQSDWDNEFIARGDNKHVLDEYFDDKRALKLTELMKRKNFWVIFIFKGEDTILRVDTPEPFDSLDKLTKTIDDMIEVAKVLELNKGEGKRLLAIRSKHAEEKAVLDIEEDDLALMSLELEEDEQGAAGKNESVDTGKAEVADVDETDKPDPKKETSAAKKKSR